MIRPAIYDPKTAVSLGALEFVIDIDVNTSKTTPIGAGHTVTVTRVLIATAAKTFTRGAIPFVDSNADWIFPDGTFSCWRVWSKYIRSFDGIIPDPHAAEIWVSPAGCQPNGFTWFGNFTLFKPDNIFGNDANVTAGGAFPFVVGGAGGVQVTFDTGLSVHTEIHFSDPSDGADSSSDTPIGDITFFLSRNIAPDSDVLGLVNIPYILGPGIISLDPVVIHQDTLRTVAGDAVNFGGTKTVSLPLDGATGTDDWTLTVTAS